MGAVTYPTIEHVAMHGRPYPAYMLEGCDTGLILFAAAFLGHNDAIWYAQAEVTTTCVDVDHERLAEMRELYPSEWAFHTADAWEWALAARREELAWDAVSVDTFTGSVMDASLESLDLWCSITNRFLTATITTPYLDPIEVPKGWETSLYPRSSNVSWLVLERE